MYILFYFLGNTQEKFTNNKQLEYIEKEITTEEEEDVLVPEGEDEITEYILKYPISNNDESSMPSEESQMPSEGLEVYGEESHIPTEGLEIHGEELHIPIEESHIPSEESYYKEEEQHNYVLGEEYHPILAEESYYYHPSENILHEEEYHSPYNLDVNKAEEKYYHEEEFNPISSNYYSTSSNESSTGTSNASSNLLEESHLFHEEEHINSVNINPDTKNKNNLQFTAPNGIPFNINISYNSQNSTNNLENNKVQTSNKETISENSNRIPYENNPPQKITKEIPVKRQNKCNKNLGTYNYSDSRIYNNSDWIYGNYAWTNEPDYYIPEESNYELPRPAKKDISSYNNCPSIPISQPLNKLISSKNFKNNGNVCPMAINTPWTEYKSGDSEPEPFNL